MTAPVRPAPKPVGGSPESLVDMIRENDQSAELEVILDEVLDSWFYEYENPEEPGKMIEGVSATGAREIARLRAQKGNPIRFPMDQMRVEDEVQFLDQVGVRVTVIARDAKSGQDSIGMAFYPYYPMIETGDGKMKKSPVRDEYADRKALGVAERNAILGLVEETLVIRVLKARKLFIRRNAALAKGDAKDARAGLRDSYRSSSAPAGAAQQ